MNPCSMLKLELLAQMERFDGLRDRFSGPRARFGMDDALTAVGAIVALAVVLYLINRWHSQRSGRQSYNSPKALFRELCTVHNLDRKTRRMLHRVARWQRLSHPARLFLEPERFESTNLSPELEPFAAELLELRTRLFTFEAVTNSPVSAVRPATASDNRAGIAELAIAEKTTDDSESVASFHDSAAEVLLKHD